MTNQPSGIFTFIRTQDIMAIAVMAVLSFAIDTTAGLVLQPILVATFGPLTGGLVSAIPNAIVIYLGTYLIPRLGAPTLYAFIFLALTTFTASFGPPGFHKLFIGLALGLTSELILIVCKRKEFSYYVAVAVAFGMSVDFTYLSWVVFSVKSAEAAMKELQPLLPVLTAAYFMLGLVGSFLAAYIFRKRLAGYAVIKRLRDGQ